MEITVDFVTKQERLDLIAEYDALGYRVIEEQRYIDGNHLIFTDEPIPEEPEPEEPPEPFVPSNPTDTVKQRLDYIENWLVGRFS